MVEASLLSLKAVIWLRRVFGFGTGLKWQRVRDILVLVWSRGAGLEYC